MKETRSGRYGRIYGQFLRRIIEEMPESQRERYKMRLIEELRRYEPNGKAEEIENIKEIDIKSPEQLANLVKEGFHLMYQADTSRRALDSLLKEL